MSSEYYTYKKIDEYWTSSRYPFQIYRQYSDYTYAHLDDNYTMEKALVQQSKYLIEYFEKKGKLNKCKKHMDRIKLLTNFYCEEFI